MRWYCVNPNLPLQAELRIRVAPDSSSPERGRISQGRAVATGSLMLQACGNDDDITPASWLQVVYLDAASNKMEEGFVMTALPNGESLVIPWEKTVYRGCCNVMDPVTLMFNGPQDAAQSLGAVQSVEFLYCIMEERKTRIRIFHAKLPSVWIDKEDLQVVCTRLNHEECSTLHAFYEMNDKLPEKAQIAVRELPSKEAHVVGLLSQEETLEVTIRSGNWLQIVGGSLDKAWIMFRTDALELLQQARDVCSSNCRMIQRGVDEFVDAKCTANQVFCANIHTVNSDLVKEQTAFTIVSQADHKVGAALVVDKPKMGDEHARVTVNEITGMTVNTDTAEQRRTWVDRPFCPAQLVAVDDNSASDTAAIRTDDIGDVGDTSASMFALDTSAEIVAPAHAVQTLDDQLFYSKLFTHGEVDADAVNNVAVAKNDGVHLNNTNMDNEQMVCARQIQPAQAKSNKIGDDDSSVASDDTDMASCKKYDIKERVNGEPALAFPSQGSHPTWTLRNAPDRNNFVGEAVTNAVQLKATKINCDAYDNNAVGADLSWDDRPIRPTRKVSADGTCSADTVTFAVCEERGTVSEPGSLSWDGSFRILAKMNDKIGKKSDAMAVIFDNNVGYNTKKIAEPAQKVESRNNRTIWPAISYCDEAQVSHENMTAGNGAANYVPVASCVGECGDGKVFGLFGGRSNKPSRAPSEEVDASSSSTAHIDRGGLATKSNAKDSAVGDLGSMHVKETGNRDRPVQPAQTLFDKIGGTDAGEKSTIVSEMDVVNTINSSKTCVSLHAANFKRDAAGSSLRSDRQVDSSVPTIVNGADDESVNRCCRNLSSRHTYVVYDEIDSNDGTGGEKEAKNNVVEPSPSNQRSIWREQTMRDTSPDSDVTRKRIGAASADANIADVPSANDDAKEFVQVEKDRQNKLAMKDFFAAGGVGSAAVTGNALAAAISVGDSAIADETHFIKARPIGMDEVEKVKPAQTATSQDYRSGLGDSAIVYSSAAIETVQDRHNIQSMTRLSVFERRYDESETTSGSENDEIALLGGLEDVFDPVDEWLSAMQDEDNERFRDDNLGTLPVTIRTEPSRYHGNAIDGEQSEHLDSSKESNSGCHFGEKKTQTGIAVQPAGISLLQAFGIQKYCEHKQDLITSADKLSLAIFEANQDNSDLVFQALVENDPLSDDWFYEVSLRNFQAYRHSPSKDDDLHSATPRLTFDLIMSGASPETILAAEQSDDDCEDFDLVISFQYPVPKRKVIDFSRPPALFEHTTSVPAGIDTKTVGATTKNRTEAIGASSASRQSSQPIHRTSIETFQEPATTAVTYSKTALSKQCISQPMIPTPRSRLRRNPAMTPVAISEPPSSLVRFRSIMHPLHSAPPVSSADSASSGLASPLEASAASICATSTSSLAPPTPSFFQRRGFVSTPSSSRTRSAPGLARNSIISSKHPEISGLSAPQKSFGFRHPLGFTKKT